MIDFNELFCDNHLNIYSVNCADPHFYGTKYTRGEQSLTVQRAVYKRSKLESLPLFQSAEDGEPELLVNQWFTKVSPECVIKFSPKQEWAFVVKFEQASEENFKILIRAGRLGFCMREIDLKHDYFEELSFVTLLQRFSLSVEALRTEHQFSQRQLLLLNKHRNNFETLLKQGVSLSEIKNRYFDILRLPDLRGILSLITLEQISGHSHTPPLVPPLVPADVRFRSSVKILDEGSASYGHYSCISENDRNEITYRNQPIMIVRMADPDSIRTWAGEIAGLEPERLLHDWYHLPERHVDSSGMVVRRLYCSELNQGIIKELVPGFSEKEYDSAERGPVLLNTYYYKERTFVEYLKKKGSSLETLRKLPGMTETKLQVLSQKKYFLSELLKHNMKLSDIAKIDEDRLVHVFDMSCSASDALKLVSVSKLFGLKKTSLRHTQGHSVFTRFFSPPAIPAVTLIEEGSSDDEEAEIIESSARSMTSSSRS